MRSEPVIVDPSKELEKCFEQLNFLLKEAEASLRKIPLPVDVSVETGEGAFLGYVKQSFGWRICYGSPDDWKPLTDCSLDVRLAVIRHLARLRDEVLLRAAEQVPKIRQAIEVLEKTLGDWQHEA